MRARFAFTLALAVIGFGFTAIVAPLSAKDHFLTVGGGYGPTGNQLSLERNVIFQQAVLSEQRPDKPAHDVFFADGDDESPDVQCRDAEFKTKCPAARRIMAEVFGDADSMDLFYRNHEVQNLRGPSDRSLLRRRLRELARELQAGDRLVIYVTGHGGEAEQSSDSDYDYEYDEESGSWKASSVHDESGGAAASAHNEYDTSFFLWESESVAASEFVKWLDRLDADVEVVLVMVQCFAGGFAHTIFEQADADLGLSSHARCGFFAQVHDRGAAGCTPDANEADYEEYSSYFWGALGGRTRTGESITTADYDGNGKVSFAEAHTYAVIESDTIDIPVCTSSALLERYSHLGKEEDESEDGDADSALGRFLGALGGGEKQAEASAELVELKGPLAELLSKSRPEQRAILEKLPAKLGLGDTPTIEALRRRMKEVENEDSVVKVKLSAAQNTHSQTLSRAQEDIREIWPELNATYAPLAMELTSERADEFAERVGKLPAYKALCEAAELQEQLANEQLELARTEARLQRLLHACKDVVRAANLPLVAPAEIVARYEKLAAMENGTLAP